MSDYTPLGIEKLTRHAAHDLSTLRCPRDGVVMRILACRAERWESGKLTRRESPRPPRNPSWKVLAVDLECPACRRRALDIAVRQVARVATGSHTVRTW